MHFWTLQDHIHTSLFKEKERNFKKNKNNNYTVFHYFVKCKVTLLKEIAKHCH